MQVQIVQISAKDTLPLRHSVLWPDHPVDFSRVAGDESALHFGAHVGGKMVSVLSLFKNESAMQLRKFATRSDCQGQGVGTLMMRHALSVAEASGADRVWLSARESAMPFYAKFGFQPFGDVFFKESQPYRNMQISLPDQSLASSA
ncbi:MULTISPECIES: GNAT family N-acetyltransferase [Donghicola]|jgi:predicted GNAT family N-acyltransferase|uniref:Putative GNAT family acetyltransferase n=1 Tax=Donghicola eburneus TaxID=393278 RepID=A0A1M4MZ08_9RHOB|nr:MULTISPECIES: GNAT family N-acetyltransferase [Donghicola]MCT4575854.1 GNAT family N-acetyltransferase [Donghicola sp.]SCM67015.1 putative GNAT family acetyltransferase [Donghicola eburneus]SFQ73243.1 Acetyltransferase (GNAT) domain-containing protein [Donghicola eburneus]